MAGRGGADGAGGEGEGGEGRVCPGTRQIAEGGRLGTRALQAATTASQPGEEV